MNITYKGSGIAITDAIRSYAEEKIGDLDKYYPGIQQIRLDLGLTSTHHHKGDGLFSAEANVTVPGHVFRAEETAADLYAAIDSLRTELKRDLSKAHKKQLDRDHRPARIAIK
ncbi:MAG: ribosome-associated translation inhibitor RaiA [Patescibacteria group bacterium]|jgi:putative sigma-54 modulation protein